MMGDPAALNPALAAPMQQPGLNPLPQGNPAVAQPLAQPISKPLDSSGTAWPQGSLGSILAPMRDPWRFR